MADTTAKETARAVRLKEGAEMMKTGLAMLKSVRADGIEDGLIITDPALIGVVAHIAAADIGSAMSSIDAFAAGVLPEGTTFAQHMTNIGKIAGH